MLQEDFFAEKRKEALEKFTHMPIPEEREEEWRYTDLKKFRLDFHAEDSEIALDGEENGIIFTDLMTAARNHPDVLKKYFGTSVKITDKFSAFHYANLANGILVVIPDGKSARLSSRISGGGHTIIVTGRNSQLDYQEEHIGNGFITDAVEIFVGEDSTINFASLQTCESDAVVFSFKEFNMKRGSRINIIYGSFGSAFHRLKSNTSLEGEGASSEVLCAYKSRKTQHIDFSVNAHHMVPHTHNNVLAKGTLADRSTAVFRGLIKIDKAAQQTDSYLADHTLLLSDGALANSIPALQIDANDVKASHGATIGQIDEEQLFYLMSRGLTREEAEHMVVTGFFEPLIDKIIDKTFQKRFRKAIEAD